MFRDREERLAALSAAQQEAMEELQKKIQMKVNLRYKINFQCTTLFLQHYYTGIPITCLTPGFWFLHSMMKAAVGIWSKLNRGKKRLLSSAVVDMLTQTTPPS